MQAGTSLSPSASCKHIRELLNHIIMIHYLTFWDRRTYGQNTGEDIREGYEPEGGAAVMTPGNDENEPFAMGDDEDQGESEESRHWKQATEPEVLLKPKYGVEGETYENVWSEGQPSAPPRENP